MIGGGLAEAIETSIAARLPTAGRPVAVGICGAQGSGKTTLAGGLAGRLSARGVRVAVLSLDDLYLTRDERVAMGLAVHKLFRTRGVPGTHDVGLGVRLFAALDAGEGVALPVFDKGADDRAPEAAWRRAPEKTEVVIFEGWCVGARAQADAALDAPVNALERERDADGRWRRAANAYLAGPYQSLFGRIDLLVLLAAPGFEVVGRWRTQQEHELRRRTGLGMTDAQVLEFIQYYERLTRHILDEMPGRADLVAWLGSDREVRPGALPLDPAGAEPQTSSD